MVGRVKDAAKAAGRPFKRALERLFDHRLAHYRMPPDMQGDLLLTFDDGPHATFTPKLLDMLDRAGARAVFFVIGERAAKEPSLLRECVARGHVLANHTYTHLNDGIGGRYSRDRVIDEIRRCGDLVGEATGVTTRWFRPPRGEINLKTLGAVRATGHEMMLWSVEGGEWGRRSHWPADRIAAHLRQTMARRDIFLMHDDNEKTLQVMPDFLSLARERGYDLASAISALAR